MLPLLTDTLAVAAAAMPALLFDASEIRLDTLHEDDAPVVVHFPFTVGGTMPITIDGGWTSCPCTRLHAYPERTLAVGDTGSVAVRFHPAGQEGEVLRSVALYCREIPGEPIAELFLSAYVLPPVDAFYAYTVRRDPLRLMKDRISLRLHKAQTSLLVANVHTTDTLAIRIGRAPAWLSSPAATKPILLPPQSAGSVGIVLDTAKLSAPLPQVATLFLNVVPIHDGHPSPSEILPAVAVEVLVEE